MSIYIGAVKMFKFLLVLITAVFFVNPVQAAGDPSIPYLITDTQVNAPGFMKPVSIHDAEPHKLTVESLEHLPKSNPKTSTFQPQPDPYHQTLGLS